MSVPLHDGKPAANEDIPVLERVIGHRLSPSFVDFLSVNDGATPESNVFDTNDGNRAGVREFIPVAKIPRVREFLDGLPPHAYPFASDDLGNHVVIDEARGGEVFFWDHEIDDHLTSLASNFAEFLKLLEPFKLDLSKIDLERVKSVWVHPDFEEMLKKLRE